MKHGKRELMGALALAACLLPASILAQAESGAALEAEADLSGSVEVDAGPAGERLLSRLDRLPAKIREEAEQLKAAREELRQAWQDEFRPGADATLEEIKAARAAFREAYKEQIEANQELRRQMVAELKETVRDRFDDEEWNEEARELYQDYQAAKQQLAQAWRETLAGLDEDATRAEIRVAREGFLEANAELVAEQKALAQQIRELVAANRPDRSLRDELPEDLKVLREEIKAMRDALQDRKRQAREELRNLSPNDREAYIRELREDLREAHNDIKDARREIIEEIRDGQDGDRRAED